MFVFMYAYAYVWMNASIHTYIPTCMHAFKHVCVVDVCMCLCQYATAQFYWEKTFKKCCAVDDEFCSAAELAQLTCQFSKFCSAARFVADDVKAIILVLTISMTLLINYYYY